MPDVEITPLANDEEAQKCAAIMSSTDPWLTLGRDYDACLAQLRDPTREIYVARDGTAVAGFIILNMRGAFTGYIQSICAAPGYRGRGVGSELVSFVERRVFEVTPNVFLCVSSFNPRARQLYERLGYKVVGELDDYLVRGHSEILMRKTIGPILSSS